MAWSTVRMVMTLAIHLGWNTKQIDFSNAFVQADLKEDVYLALPPEFTGQGGGSRKDTCLKLQKSLYGLFQEPKAWNQHLTKSLEALGYNSSVNDPCMFFGNGVILLAYVDDILVFGPDVQKINAALRSFEDAKMVFTEEQDVYAFLGVEVQRNNDTGEITLLQSGLIDKVIKAAGMEESNSMKTPASSMPLYTDAEGDPMSDDWNYASIIGMLMYLASNSRPDIQFAVHQCVRFTHNPRQSHANGVKRILRYLSGTRHKGMIFKPDEIMKLDCYVDADYAGLWRYESDQDPVSVKSRTGYVMTLGNCPLVWASKLQSVIALSTLEAEYIALSMSMRELIPLRRLLNEVGV